MESKNSYETWEYIINNGITEDIVWENKEELLEDKCLLTAIFQTLEITEDRIWEYVEDVFYTNKSLLYNIKSHQKHFKKCKQNKFEYRDPSIYIEKYEWFDAQINKCIHCQWNIIQPYNDIKLISCYKNNTNPMIKKIIELFRICEPNESDLSEIKNLHKYMLHRDEMLFNNPNIVSSIANVHDHALYKFNKDIVRIIKSYSHTKCIYFELTNDLEIDSDIL